MEQTNQTIYPREARHITYIKPVADGAPDLHCIKEQVHYPDGSTKPELKLVWDYKRPYYVKKRGLRKEQQWKEWEDIDKLIKYEARQCDLARKAAQALGTPWVKGGLREVSDSPYLYGSDITSTSIIKKTYEKRFAKQATPYTVAVADTETDTIHGHGDIMICSMSFKDKIITAIDKRFVEGQVSVEERIRDLCSEYIGDIMKARGIVLEIKICENPVEVIKTVIDKGHEWKPDFMTWWNIDFDIQEIRKMCEKYDGNMAEIFSDPSVPKEYQFFEYNEGQRQKKTASGKFTPIKPAAQWHHCTAPASFWLSDSMRVYKQIRTGQQERPSYSLDAILAHEKIGISKLKFDKAKHVEHNKLKWHQFMQEHYPLEYIVYNIVDCIAVEMFDEKTKDLQQTMPQYSRASDFGKFNSQPRRKVDDLHWYCLDNGKVIGTTGKEMVDEFSTLTKPLSGWITALNAHCITTQGLPWVKELNAPTRIYAHVGD